MLLGRRCQNIRVSQDSSQHHVFERAVNMVCCGVNHAPVPLATVGKLTKFLHSFRGQGPFSFFAEVMFLLCLAGVTVYCRGALLKC